MESETFYAVAKQTVCLLVAGIEGKQKKGTSGS